MKLSPIASVRTAAVLLACLVLGLRSGVPVDAQSGVTITSPAAGAVLAAGPDFAWDTLSDPWDFLNREDVALDPSQLDGWSSFSVANGVVGGTVSTSRVGASNGSNFYFLQRAYWGILNPTRTGRQWPINSGHYTKLAFKMGSTRGDQFPRIFWFHNELGTPSGEIGGWKYVDPNTPTPAGDNIYVVDLTTANQASPWTAGNVTGLAFYPNSSAVGYQVQVDWIRLTTGDGNAASKFVPITWSGGSGTSTIQVRDAAGTVLTVASGISATTFNWNYGVLPPGTYTVTVIRGGVASAARSFRINNPPTVQLTDPDASGGEDFATTVLGNPWDMQDATDVKNDGGATIVDHVVARSFSGGLYHGTSDASGDPQTYLLSNPSAANTHDTIDTTRYHRLTFSLQVDRAFDLGLGSVARVFWGSGTGGGAPYANLAVTKDIITWPGLNSYTIDLAPLSAAPDGGLEPSGPTPWTSARMRHLRIDPNEFPESLNFHMGPVKLAADDETSNGSFTIRWAGGDADGEAATIALYYDTNRDSSSGLTPIVSGVPLSAGAYTWNAGSVPQGTYFIFALASDGRNTTGAYSTGPVRVGGFVPGGSRPLLNVDTPANGSSGAGQFSISGWAADLGASSGSGVDSVVAYADPGTAGQVFLGVARMGIARPDVAGAFGAQFGTSGFSITVGSLGAGTHTLAVYAHSTVSNANFVKTVTYTVNAGGPMMALDEPANGSVCQQPCPLSGWAIDSSAASGTGIDAVHVYAFPAAGGAGRLVGVAQYGTSRPDVGAALGARFTNSGYRMMVRGLAPGTYALYAYGHSVVTNSFSVAKGTTVTARNAPRMSIDGPGSGAVVAASGFTVSGWAVDLAAASGPGVDAVHVYAFPAGSSTARFVGVATYNVSRPDVGSAFGNAQFTASGYNLRVTNLPAGTWDLAVYAHSAVSGAFDNAATVRMTVR